MADIEANKNVACRYMQAVVDGDIATIEGLQHPDCTWWILGFGDISGEFVEIKGVAATSG